METALDLLKAYMEGKRGANLQGYLSTGDSLTPIETKLGELSRNLALDVDRDGVVTKKDIDKINAQFRRTPRIT